MRLSKTQKEILQNQLNNEKGIIEELKKVYGDAVKEIDDKIALLQTQIGNIQQSGKSAKVTASMVQSKVYQKQYQQAVRDQVSGILDKLNGSQFDSVSGYLTKCYTDGYISTMYDLTGQGLPLIMPIDQKAVVQALSTNSKLSKSLYESLGENINDMKKKVVAEISRGIAGNLSYAEIARNISGRSNAGMNRSIRIARTEGQRIQNTAAYDAQGKAKEKGADILKQWCATLDSRTRDSHRELDGKIVEVDEEFTINGVSAMFPGDFGDPAEDCNCRCCILQRAKWDLGEKELDTLKERAEFYGLDKSKDFEDFKIKYIAALESIAKSGGNDKIENVKGFDELEKYLSDKYGINVDKSVETLDFETCKKTMMGVESVFSDYPDLSQRITTISTKDNGVMCCSGTEIFFNPRYYKDVSEFEDMCKRCSDMGWWPSNSSPLSIGAHETGHAVESLLLSLKEYDYDWQRVMDWNSGVVSGDIVSQAVKNIKKTEYGKGKKQADLMKAVSGYAATKKGECFAEAFADVASNGENANPLSLEIKRLAIEKYNKLKG